MAPPLRLLAVDLVREARGLVLFVVGPPSSPSRARWTVQKTLPGACRQGARPVEVEAVAAPLLLLAVT